MMKKTGIFLAVAAIVSLSIDCDAVPVKRQERVAPEHRSQQAKQLVPWYPGYPDVTGYQVMQPILPVYPGVQYQTANYYPALLGVEDPYDPMGLDDIGLFRSGQKKQGRKDQPAEEIPTRQQSQ